MLPLDWTDLISYTTFVVLFVPFFAFIVPLGLARDNPVYRMHMIAQKVTCKVSRPLFRVQARCQFSSQHSDNAVLYFIMISIIISIN